MRPAESDEEAWLQALETGQVNSRGYLPERSDTTNLTARQVSACVQLKGGREGRGEGGGETVEGWRGGGGREKGSGGDREGGREGGR